MSAARPRVALVGAAGLIGSLLSEGLSDQFEIVRLDRTRRGSRAERVTRVDARRIRRLRKVLLGCDAAVDLAAVARSEAPWNSIYRNNIRTCRNVLEAARLAGVPRVVYASSNQVTKGYELDEPMRSVMEGHYEGLDASTLPRVTPGWSPRPISAYGASKAWGEIACGWYARAHGLSTVAIRIGTVRNEDRPRSPRHFATWLSHKDVVGLFRAALTTPNDDLPEVVWGVSANTWRIWDPLGLPGFVPQDNAEAWR